MSIHFSFYNLNITRDNCSGVSHEVVSKKLKEMQYSGTNAFLKVINNTAIK